MPGFNEAIHYASWFECMALFGFSEPILSQEISKRINSQFDLLMGDGVKDAITNEQIKVDALKLMQYEQGINKLRLSYLTSHNIRGAFDNLIVLGQIWDRIIIGTIDKLKKLN